MTDPEACQFCLEGAIRKTYPHTWLEKTHQVEEIIKQKYPNLIVNGGGIPAFNDNKKTTFTMIREIIRAARI